MLPALKIRLIGAAVLVAVAVIVVPLFFPTAPDDSGKRNINLYIPPVPDQELKTRTISVMPSNPAGQGGSSGTSGDTLARVNIPSQVPAEVTPVGGSTPAQQAAAGKPSGATAASTSAKSAQGAASASGQAGNPGQAAQVHYVVHLGAYATRDNAQDLAAKVQKLGFPVRLTKADVNGKPAARVDAGPFDTRAAAEHARLTLSAALPHAPAKLATVATDQTHDTPAPKAKPGATAAAGWAVQVVAYSKQSDADALRDKLRKAGFDGYVDSVKSGGNTLWRVRVGPQTQRADALALRDSIKRKFPKLSGIVVNVP